jgi:hypothetical protein
MYVCPHFRRIITINEQEIKFFANVTEVIPNDNNSEILSVAILRAD